MASVEKYVAQSAMMWVSAHVPFLKGKLNQQFQLKFSTKDYALNTKGFGGGYILRFDDDILHNLLSKMSF